MDIKRYEVPLSAARGEIMGSVSVCPGCSKTKRKWKVMNRRLLLTAREAGAHGGAPGSRRHVLPSHSGRHGRSVGSASQGTNPVQEAANLRLGPCSRAHLLNPHEFGRDTFNPEHHGHVNKV